MIDDSVKQSFLTLVRLGIGNEAKSVPESVDWRRMKALAVSHGLSAVVLDGVSRLSGMGLLNGNRAMDAKMKTQWIASVVQTYENRYKDYRDSIGRLAGFYNSHGYKLMLLKGYGLSLDWPVPQHRPTGDIDIWAFGRYKEADAALHNESGIEIDNSHHHHTVFRYNGFMVENHYDLVNVHSHRSNSRFEKILKELAMDDSCRTEIDGQRIYLPSPNFHVLFLLRHSLSHFAAVRMTMRQLLDYALFVRAHNSEIDWKWLQSVLAQYQMTDFFMCLNDICIGSLGFSTENFPPVSVDRILSERVLNDLLSPEFSEKMPKDAGVVRRVLFKWRRWRSNAWKHKLCYRESLFSSFFVSAWAHLLKPSSI